MVSNLNQWGFQSPTNTQSCEDRSFGPFRKGRCAISPLPIFRVYSNPPPDTEYCEIATSSEAHQYLYVSYFFNPPQVLLNFADLCSRLCRGQSSRRLFDMQKLFFNEQKWLKVCAPVYLEWTQSRTCFHLKCRI